MIIQYTEKYNMSFLMPKMPPMPAIPAPQPLPTPPSYEDADRKAAIAEKERKIRAARTGRASTILTTASGLEDDETSTKKTLLGQ